VQAFTCRVKQLEQFIVSQGLQVPEPDLHHVSTIDSLVTAYPLESSDDLPWSAPDYIPPVLESVPTAHREQTRPRVDEAMIAQSGQPRASDHPGFFRDETFSHDFGHTLNVEQMNLPTEFDLDWILGLTNSDNPYGAFDMDMSGSTTFAGLASNSTGVHSLFGDPMLAENSHHDVPIADYDTSSDEEDHKEVTGQISDRIGTLLGTTKGNWRFYGATSNLHLSKDRHALQLEPRRTSQQRTRISAQLEFLQLDQNFDAHFTQHLIRLYFTWQNPSLHIVDQDAFEQGRDLCISKGESSTFHTEFLVNAMSVPRGFPTHMDADGSSGVLLVRLSRATRAQIFPSTCQITSPAEQRLSWRSNWTSPRLRQYRA
jgi:hypothetical protein